MKPEAKRPRSRAAAIPLLLMTSLMAFAPASAETVEETDALMDQLHRNLDLAGALAQTDDAFAAAKLATAWQAAALGVELESAPAPQHDAPSAAVLALVERHGVAPTADQAAQIAALDDLPAAKRDALTGVVDAFLALEDATRVAYQDADPDALAALAQDAEASEAGTTALVDTGVQVGLILGTRNDFLDATQAFQDAFGDLATPSTASAEPGVDLCPALALDLDGLETTYNDNCALVLDVGGDDTYLNNAGGSKLVGASDNCSLGTATAALFDVSGNDQYASGGVCGHNGGGFDGVGFLLDRAGNDAYTAGVLGTNGGGSLGVGFLLDQAGNDTYSAGSRGANGGGEIGVGFLLDQRGGDVYTAGDDGTNGGGSLGVGFLLDQNGSDVYTAGDDSTNGGGAVGVGFLLDQSGNDTYSAGSRGANGGGFDGVGFLWDQGGTDEYWDSDGGTGTDRTVVPKGTIGAQIDSGNVDGEGQRLLLSVQDVPVAPSLPLPPTTIPGQEVPDHEGTEPVPVADVGSVVTYDDGSDLCVDFVPEGSSSAQNIACVARSLLGPADGLIPREETPVAAGVPGTNPQPTPDAEEIPEETFGSTPEVTLDLHAGYHYDDARLFRAAGLLGDEVEAWIPFAPGDEAWFLGAGDDVDLFLTVTVYQDGQEVDTVPVSVPFLGQALAAAEATAGTL